MSWFTKYILDPVKKAFNPGEDERRRRDAEARRLGEENLARANAANAEKAEREAQERAARDAADAANRDMQAKLLEEAKKANETAAATQAELLRKQQEAQAAAALAAVPERDSEPARRAAERQARKLAAAGAFNSRAKTFGAAPIGFRALSGS